MVLTINKSDYEFLLLSIKFCNEIDKYAFELNLDNESITAYKEDSEVLLHVFNNMEQFPNCAESFINYMLDKMKNSLSSLAEVCKSSKNYTVHIGKELGIEVPVYAFLPN